MFWGGDAEDKPPGLVTASESGECSLVHRAREPVVAVDERVDHELADGVRRVVVDLDLDAARRAERVHPAADGDRIEQGLDGGEQGSRGSDAGGGLAPWARPVLVGEAVIGDGGGDRLGVTED